MPQITLRIPDQLASDLKAAAGERDMSVNRYATAVLKAATDPEHAGTGQEELIARLLRAGLLDPIPAPRPVAPGPDLVEGARRKAGSGRPLSEIVSSDRG